MTQPIKTLATLTFTAGLLCSHSISAQDYQRPYNEYGQPDLQGMWSSASVTRLRRPRGVEKLTVTEEEAIEMANSDFWTQTDQEQSADTSIKDLATGQAAAAFATRGYNSFWLNPGDSLALVKDEFRTSMIVEPSNGQIPYVENGEAMRRNPVGAPPLGSFDGPETRSAIERCLVGFVATPGPIMLNGIYNNTYQIVQNEDYVVILAEMVHDARIIRLNQDHRSDGQRLWLGDSVGWYEGDTLVVETVNVNPIQRAFISSEGKVTERFTRWSDDQILYEFTVEDPNYYTQTWRGEMSWNASAEPLYEYACHEGNHSFPGILAGARRLEMDGVVVDDNYDIEQ